GHADGSQIIGLHHAFIFTHRDLEKPSEGAVAGVVDQDIDAPPGTFHLIHQRLNGIFVGHIAGEGGAGAQLFRQLPEGFRPPGGEDGKIPPPGQQPGDFPSDSAGGTGDENDSLSHALSPQDMGTWGTIFRSIRSKMSSRSRPVMVRPWFLRPTTAREGSSARMICSATALAS